MEYRYKENFHIAGALHDRYASGNAAACRGIFQQYAGRKMIDNSYQNLNVISEKLDLLTQNIESYSVLVLTNKDVQKWLEGQKKANYSVKQDVFAYLLNIIKSNCISNLIIHTYHDTGKLFLSISLPMETGKKRILIL